MPTVSPAPLSERYLLFAEREEIAVLQAQRCGVREIARRIGGAPSTVSRELRRNASTSGGGVEYRASAAQWPADRRARRPKVSKLAANDVLREYVQDRRWAKSWSPEQISNRLRLEFPHDESMPISHEAI